MPLYRDLGLVEIFQKHVFVCVSGKTCPNEGAVDVCDKLRQHISEVSVLVGVSNYVSTDALRGGQIL